MKKIFLTQGQVALVDDDQYEFLNQWKWHVSKVRTLFYAVKISPRINGKQTITKMHHEIFGKPLRGLEIDHRNGNGLDNQRHNLRFVTHRQNCQNRKDIIKTSQYPGVSWDKRDKKWRANIQINGKYNSLGYFVDELEAFNAYKQAVESIGEKMIEDF